MILEPESVDCPLTFLEDRGVVLTCISDPCYLLLVISCCCLFDFASGLIIIFCTILGTGLFVAESMPHPHNGGVDTCRERGCSLNGTWVRNLGTTSGSLERRLPSDETTPWRYREGLEASESFVGRGEKAIRDMNEIF